MTESSEEPDKEAPDALLWKRWRKGERVDVSAFLASFADLDVTEQVAVLLVDQRERWQVGERIPAETYLRRFPTLENDTEAVVELAYGEFLLREERGERPSLDEYLWRFPDRAARLRQQVELHSALRSNGAVSSGALVETSQGLQSGRSGSDPSTSADGTVDHAATPGGTVDHVPALGGTVDHVPAGKRSAELAPAQTVAGYEILGTLGRGGMGVVYKARQRGLKRVVALKMILSGDHASEHDLSRFRSEAEAVARLQHPGIVQIYEVGEDGGRPFFSLEFIDGVSLDKKIRGTPLPPREAAALVREMAVAMDYAHKNGVVHRDLKPANVLLTSDGVPKIGDFGLAKRLEEDESGLTRSGTILGTPSYMAPEQAEGKIHEVGPLADVYSLGAVLYETLTGRPPFRGTTMFDTLQQLRTKEPVAPTQLQPGVPRDLETICLKCLQKERGKRYESAGELAADLERFAKNEPIQARPVGRPERLWRWCRRNPRIAALIGATAAVVVAWAVTASLMAWQLEVKQGETEKERVEAVYQKGVAETNEQHAKFQKGEAEKSAALAKKEAKNAIENSDRQRVTGEEAFRGLIDITKKTLGRLQSKRLAIKGTPEVKKLRADVLADLRQSLGVVSQKIQGAATTTFAQESAAVKLGDLLLTLGQGKEARELYELAHQSAKRRAEEEPNNDKARANLGVSETRLGEIALGLSGDARTARDHFLKARKLHEEILLRPRSEEYPPIKMKRSMSFDDILLGQALLALGRPAEARKYFQEALDYREEWSKAEPKNDEARTYIVQARMWLGTVSCRLKDPQGAKEHFEKGLALCEALWEKYSDSILIMTDLADVQGTYGDALLRQGQPKEAEKLYRASLQNLEEAIAGNPDDLSRQPLLALTHERLGQVAALLTEPAKAKKHFLEAKQLQEELWLIDKGNLSRQTALVAALARAGNYKNASDLATAIRSRMVQSNELMLQIARSFAICAAGDAAGRPKHVAQALSALTAATGDGYKDAVAIATDPDLAALREEPAFRALVEQLRKR